MPREAPELDRIERWMHSVVTHPEGAKAGVNANSTQNNEEGLNLDQTVLPSDELSTLDRISIYANSYFWRLNEVMSHEYPTVSQILGEELFSNVVKDYVTHHPSTFYSLNRLSEQFPQYLQSEVKDIPHKEFVATVATVERAMEDVFDEKYKERVPFETFQNIPTEQWGDIHLQFNPALHLFELDYPVNDYMTAVRENRQMKIPPAEKTCVVVYRCNYSIWREDLDQTRYLLLSRLKSGESLGASVEACALLPDVEFDTLTTNLGEWFKQWATNEFFCGVTYQAI